MPPLLSALSDLVKTNFLR